MQAHILSFVLAHPALFWFLFGIFCLLLEMLLPGFFMFFLGVGAWCAALVALIPAASFSVQILVFLASSLVLLAFLRTRFKQMFQGGVLEGRLDGSAPLENTLAEVVAEINPPAPGKVKCGGTFWQAVSERPLARGAQVRVLARCNLTLTVEAVEAVSPSNSTQGA